MSIVINNKFGTVEINEDVIKSLAGAAATECYGVIGMASKQFFRDGLAELLKQENYSRGVVIRHVREQLHIDVYVIIGYGIRLTEVIYEIQKKVKYDVEAALAIPLTSVNVFVQDVHKQEN